MAKGFKGPTGKDPMGMMQQLQQLQQQLMEAQDKLKDETVTGSSGGGAVKITVTGDQRCTAVEIAPDLVADADVDLLQDMILTAVNSALEESRTLAQDRLGPLTGGLGI